MVIILNCVLNSFLLPDIDECTERIDGCAQICTDTDGSYTCSCNSGYQLGNNNHDCDGKTMNVVTMSILVIIFLL